jgi:DNA-binding ferritin-like protein
MKMGRNKKWHEVNEEACNAVVQGLEHYATRLRAVSAFAADQQVTEFANSARSQAEAVEALVRVVETLLEPPRKSIEK